MSLPREKIAELSRMNLNDLYEIVGREAYLTFKGSDVIDFSIKQQYEEPRIRNLFRNFAPNIEVVIDSKNLIRSAKRLLSRLRNDFRKKICTDWNYCKKRGRYSDDIALSQAIVGVVGSVVPGLSLLGCYGVATILTKKGLDRFCHCPPRGRRGLVGKT